MKKFIYLICLIVVFCSSIPVEAKKKQYPNGDYYEGEWKKSSPHGMGTMKYANGNIYRGQWVLGVVSGTGKCQYANGNYYEGEWEKNSPSGTGIMKYANGDYYQGEWRFGAVTGTGKFIYANGIIYEGSLVKSKKSGTGSLKVGVRSYKGEWLNDEFIGGTCTQGDTIWTGTFQNGEFLNGKVAYANGDFFVGEFKDKKFWNGQVRKSVDTDSVGYTMTGEMTNGVLSKGIKRYNNGRFLDGEWVNGRFYNGTCDAYIGKDYYCGEMKNGVFTGKCSILNVSPDICTFDGFITEDQVWSGSFEYGYADAYYTGTMKNFKKNGSGAYRVNQRVVFSDTPLVLQVNGEWKDDLLVKGKGTVKCNHKDYNLSIALNNGQCVVSLLNYKKPATFKCANDAQLLSNLLDEVCSYLFKEMYVPAPNPAPAPKVEALKVKPKAGAAFIRKYLVNHVFQGIIRDWGHPLANALLGDLRITVTLEFVDDEHVSYQSRAMPQGNSYQMQAKAQQYNSTSAISKVYGFSYENGIVSIAGDESYKLNAAKNQLSMVGKGCVLKRIK